jgi:hypothetical protein
VTRSVRLIALVVCAGAVCAVAPALGSADPAVHAAGKCKLSSSEQRGGLGPTYVTSLSVSHVSCKTGKSLVKAYYKCRVKAGGVKGRCVKKVSGYSCRETRSGISVQFNASVTCKRGKKVVKHSYTQNT